MRPALLDPVCLVSWPLQGCGCVVAAPSKLQRPAADRIKTDARDALHVAWSLWMDQIVEVRASSEAQEAAGDLVRPETTSVVI